MLHVKGQLGLDRFHSFHNESKTYSILLICSIVETIAALFALPGSGKTKFAVALGFVSIAVTLALIFVKDLQRNAVQLASFFLLGWWGVGVAVTTFPSGAPFLGTGNGFFSCWIAAVFSAKLVFASGDAQQ